MSGYQIPKPNDSKKGEIIDPFIKIEVHGVKEDTQQCKTSVKENNGKLKSYWSKKKLACMHLLTNCKIRAQKRFLSIILIFQISILCL